MLPSSDRDRAPTVETAACQASAPAGKKLRILALTGHYLPGYKAGGPIRTLANLVDWLGDELDIHIVTLDRDLGDTHPYPGTPTGQWRQVGQAKVMYLPPGQFGLRAWSQRLPSLDYDVLYLNSFFSRLTLVTLLLRRAQRRSTQPVVIAPRGELSPGALSLKRHKKWVYLSLVRPSGLFRNVTWQATSTIEAADIQRMFGADLRAGTSRLRLVPNLPRRAAPPVAVERPPKNRGELQLVYCSRISPKKNLDLALRLLRTLSGAISLHIYGPIEAEGYWRHCQSLMSDLPANVRVEYRGSLAPDQVMPILGRYHVFLLPSRSENFGHAILEALGAGCLPLISDETPWRHLRAHKAGWDVPVEQPERWRAALKEAVDLSQADFSEWSAAAREMAGRFSQDAALLESARDLFLQAGGR